MDLEEICTKIIILCLTIIMAMIATGAILAMYEGIQITF